MLFLSNDPTGGANKANLQILDFCLPQPKSKLASYSPLSASQEITDSIQFDYKIRGNVLMMENRLKCSY